MLMGGRLLDDRVDGRRARTTRREGWPGGDPSEVVCRSIPLAGEEEQRKRERAGRGGGRQLHRRNDAITTPAAPAGRRRRAPPPPGGRGRCTGRPPAGRAPGPR